jgi:hypothetical protein
MKHIVYQTTITPRLYWAVPIEKDHDYDTVIVVGENNYFHNAKTEKIKWPSEPYEAFVIEKVKEEKVQSGIQLPLFEGS